MVLWFIMGFQIVTLIASEIFQLLECRPVQAMWKPVLNADCMPVQQVWAIGYVFVGRLFIPPALNLHILTCSRSQYVQ